MPTKPKKKGMSLGAKIAIGIGSVAVAGLGAAAYQVSSSKGGQWLGRQHSRRSSRKYSLRGRWN